jgi:co-chaperonin GroES (HSP10)
MALTAMQHDRDPGEAILEAVGASLPRPTGYNILVGVYVRPEKTAGGVYITPRTRDEDRYQGKIGLVLALGPEAYADDDRFPDGPWCRIGDWVMWKAHDGAGFELNGHPCRLISDDGVRAVLDGPDGVL